MQADPFLLPIRHSGTGFDFSEPHGTINAMNNGTERQFSFTNRRLYILALIFLLSPSLLTCADPVRVIKGQAFLALEDGETLKLSALQIFPVNEAWVLDFEVRQISFMTNELTILSSIENDRARIAALAADREEIFSRTTYLERVEVVRRNYEIAASRGYGSADEWKEKLRARVADYEQNVRIPLNRVDNSLEFWRNQSERDLRNLATFPSTRFEEKNLPAFDCSPAVTDADGRFVLQVTNTGKVSLFAVARRKFADKAESTVWLIPISGASEQSINLHNHNTWKEPSQKPLLMQQSTNLLLRASTNFLKTVDATNLSRGGRSDGLA